MNPSLAAVDLRDASDASAFGGKAAHLARSLREELPAPGGIALGYELVDALAREVKPDLLARALAGYAGPWAVRSSAVGEDSAQASFAGMHLSVLNVASPEGCAEAVARVHGSACDPSALAYRKKMGLEARPRMGVVIQVMVAAEIAGVLFTRNPATGAEELLIEAAWGLGPSVVEGLVVPDQYRLSRAGEILEAAAGIKDIRVLPSPGGGTEEVEVTGAEAEAQCLDEARLGELHALALRCEKVFGEGLDLEWAFSRGRLHLLQCRRITTKNLP